MKIISFYLPQFHEMEENNRWWGKGFTEWTNMKKAKPLFPDHNQPRIPLNENYYDLLDKNTMLWQSSIAKKNGVYGFCFYHYWFGDLQLMEKPLEIFLNNSDIDIHFCFSWANESWTRAWASKKDEILVEQKYGGRDEWQRHFDYLLPFFKDERYILEDGKPVFIIYRPENIPCLNEMLLYFETLAKQNGFTGMCFMYQQVAFKKCGENDDSLFSYNIEYQPAYALYDMKKEKKQNIIVSGLKRIKRRFHIKTRGVRNALTSVTRISYDALWREILAAKPDGKSVAGAFVDWYNTPRRGNKGWLCDNVSVDSFQKYFSLLVDKVMTEYSTDYIFVFAWNEWAEGGYLEPDEKNEYGYLEAIRKVLSDKDQLPD